MTELRLLASEGMKRVQNCLSCRQRRARAKTPVRTEIQLTIFFFFFFSSTAPLTPMESPWSTEVVALRAGWPCWPLAADSYRNTKTHLIGWDSLYPGKSLLGVIVFCIHKRLFDSCHFSRETEMVCLKWKATQQKSARKKKKSWVKTMRFLPGVF